jgi:hypothetical protein
MGIEAGPKSRLRGKWAAGEMTPMFDSQTIRNQLGASDQERFNASGGTIGTDFSRSFADPGFLNPLYPRPYHASMYADGLVLCCTTLKFGNDIIKSDPLKKDMLSHCEPT